MTPIERKAIREALTHLHKTNTQKGREIISGLIDDANMRIEDKDEIEGILGGILNKQLKCEEWLLALLEEQ